MFDAENLRHVERVYRFRYPLAFWERRQELASLAETEWFRATYPAARLVGTHDEVWAARQADQDLADDLIPFMIVSGQQFPDYYGFQAPRRCSAETAELPVLVWCIHAYVHGWDAGFGAFLDELQVQRAKQGQADPGAAPDPAGG
jgi:hypothetical protein